MDVSLLQVPNDSSESNAKLIGQYIREHAASDTRKFILVGYSKGTPDIQVALAQEPALPNTLRLLSLLQARPADPRWPICFRRWRRNT